MPTWSAGITSKFSSSRSVFSPPYLLPASLTLILHFSWPPPSQEEQEIPSSVFVKDPPPFPRDQILEEEEGADMSRPAEGDLTTINLSSDEDVGLEAEPEEEEELWPLDLENMEKTRAEKLKRSSLKKVRQRQKGPWDRVSICGDLPLCLRAGGQFKEGILQTEHWEEND